MEWEEGGHGGGHGGGGWGGGHGGGWGGYGGYGGGYGGYGGGYGGYGGGYGGYDGGYGGYDGGYEGYPQNYPSSETPVYTNVPVQPAVQQTLTVRVAPEEVEEEEGEGTIEIAVIDLKQFLNGEYNYWEPLGYGDEPGWPQEEPPIAQNHYELKCPPKGCFRTTRGILRLNVKGKKATGQFRNKTLSGKFRGNILVGVWKKPAKGKHPAKSGAFQMAFQENCKGFIGVWGYKGDRPLTRTWKGQKIKCPKQCPKPKTKQDKPKPSDNK